MENEFQPWISNALFLISFAALGFYLTYLIRRIDKGDSTYVNKELCNEKHTNIDKTLEERFDRLNEKIDTTNSIGEGLINMGKEIAKAINSKD